MATKAADTGQLASSSVSSDGGTTYRAARIVAVVAGLLGALLAIATPLLPVKQTTAQLNWPQNGVLGSVEAPLIGYVATDLNISIPCQAAAGLAWRAPRSPAVQAAQPLSADTVLLPDESADEIVERIRTTAATHFLLVDADGRPAGVLLRSDITRVLADRS